MRPRIRTIKPEFYGDEKVTALSRDARFLTVGLISMADDRGRNQLSIAAIHGFVYPKEGDVRDAQVRKWLDEVLRLELALVHDHGAWRYLWLPNFWRHQVINKPTESALPAHPDDPYGHLPIEKALAQFREDSRSSPVVLRPSRAGAHSFPFPSVVDVVQTPSKVSETQRPREPRKTVQQDELPDDLNGELADRARAALEVLLGVQGERGGHLPTLRGVGLAVRRFPDRDHSRVVRELEHWALAGVGQRKEVRDWARTYATFLDGSPAGAPVRVASNGRVDRSDPHPELTESRLAALDRLQEARR